MKAVAAARRPSEPPGPPGPRGRQHRHTYSQPIRTEQRPAQAARPSSSQHSMKHGRDGPARPRAPGPPSPARAAAPPHLPQPMRTKQRPGPRTSRAKLKPAQHEARYAKRPSGPAEPRAPTAQARAAAPPHLPRPMHTKQRPACEGLLRPQLKPAHSRGSTVASGPAGPEPRAPPGPAGGSTATPTQADAHQTEACARTARPSSRPTQHEARSRRPGGRDPGPQAQRAAAPPHLPRPDHAANGGLRHRTARAKREPTQHEARSRRPGGPRAPGPQPARAAAPPHLPRPIRTKQRPAHRTARPSSSQHSMKHGRDGPAAREPRAPARAGGSTATPTQADRTQTEACARTAGPS